MLFSSSWSWCLANHMLERMIVLLCVSPSESCHRDTRAMPQAARAATTEAASLGRKVASLRMRDPLPPSEVFGTDWQISLIRRIRGRIGSSIPSPPNAHGQSVTMPLNRINQKT